MEKTNINDGNKMADKLFMRSIYVSVLSIVLCVAVLCSVTWAWFSESVSSSTNMIKSGNCTVEIAVTDSLGNEVLPSELSNEKYELPPGSYKISVTSYGSARTSYCKLKIANIEYYTQQVSTAEPDNSISFTLTFDNNTTLEIYGRWGSYHIPDEERDFYNNGEYSVISQRQPESNI